MRIYRYLLSEVSKSIFAVATVLLLIFVSGRFVKYLGDVASGSMSSKALFSIMFYRLPGFMEFILPLGFFLGVMLAYGRLYVESEMVVLQACGVSKRRLLLYTQIPALIVMFFTASFTLYYTPAGWKQFYKVWNDPNTYSGLGTLVEGSFKNFFAQNLVVYAAEMNSEKNHLEDVLIVRSNRFAKVNRLVLIKAKRADVVSAEDHEPFIELYDGTIYNGVPGSMDFNATRYGVYGQRLSSSEPQGFYKDTLDEVPTSALIKSDGRKEKVALQWRISLPFILPVLAIIALALSETNHRKGRYIKLLPGIIVYLFYIVLLIAVRSRMEKSVHIPLGSLWIIHLLFLLIGISLLYVNELKFALARRRSKKS